MISFVHANEKGDAEIKSSKYTEGNCLKQKTFTNSNGKLTIYSDDKDLIKSSKIFGKVGSFSIEIFDEIQKYYLSEFLTYSHSLRKIQGQLTQKIEGIVEHPLLVEADNYFEENKIVKDRIVNEPEKATNIIIYLKKRIFELGAHMTNFEILHMSEKISIDKRKHNLRKLIMSVWHGLEDNFEEINIKCAIKFDKEFAENNLIFLDYKTINVVLYNLFDNALKYAMPVSEIRFYLDIENKEFQLKMTMMSQRIEKDELSSLCRLGFRGRNCTNANGTGVGLYIIKKSLDLNDLTFLINPDYSVATKRDGKQYVLNRFIISGSV